MLAFKVNDLDDLTRFDRIGAGGAAGHGELLPDRAKRRREARRPARRAFDREGQIGGALAGDGIGPEAMVQVRRVIDWMGKRRSVGFDIDEGLVGGAAIDAEGAPVSDATVEKAMKADAVLLGAVGGPKWDDLPFAQKPERGLLRLRKDMVLFANLRPALCFDALVDASALKPELVSGLDIMIVRELTGGIYFGEPRGIETLPDGTRRGINTQVYTTGEIQRVARVAFDLARKRGNRLC